MKIHELFHQARQLNIPFDVLEDGPQELIPQIQHARGETACFKTEHRYNCSDRCDWAKECKSVRAAWK